MGAGCGFATTIPAEAVQTMDVDKKAAAAIAATLALRITVPFADYGLP
jgi:hypothetical protein